MQYKKERMTLNDHPLFFNYSIGVNAEIILELKSQCKEKLVATVFVRA